MAAVHEGHLTRRRLRLRQSSAGQPGHPEGPAVLGVVTQPQGPSQAGSKTSRLAKRPRMAGEWLPPRPHLHLQGMSRQAALILGCRQLAPRKGRPVVCRVSQKAKAAQWTEEREAQHRDGKNGKTER